MCERGRENDAPAVPCGLPAHDYLTKHTVDAVDAGRARCGCVATLRPANTACCRLGGATPCRCRCVAAPTLLRVLAWGGRKVRIVCAWRAAPPVVLCRAALRYPSCDTPVRPRRAGVRCVCMNRPDMDHPSTLRTGVHCLYLSGATTLQPPPTVVPHHCLGARPQHFPSRWSVRLPGVVFPLPAQPACYEHAILSGGAGSDGSCSVWLDVHVGDTCDCYGTWRGMDTLFVCAGIRTAHALHALPAYRLPLPDLPHTLPPRLSTHTACAHFATPCHRSPRLPSLVAYAPSRDTPPPIPATRGAHATYAGTNARTPACTLLWTHYLQHARAPLPPLPLPPRCLMGGT